MLLPEYEYHRPADLAQAVGLLAELGADAKLLAGGTDLLVNLKHGAISGTCSTVWPPYDHLMLPMPGARPTAASKTNAMAQTNNNK